MIGPASRFSSTKCTVQPVNFDAVFERLPLRFKPRERRQQRRMNIQDASGKRRHKIRRKQPHVSREAHEIDFLFFQRRDNELVVRLALESLRRDHARFEAPRARLVDPLRALAIAEHERDLRVRDAPRRNAIGQSLEIGAAARKQHGDAFFHVRKN